MTFSILHVYLQRKTTLGVHTCSCILMIFDIVCMFYFYILMIICLSLKVYLHVLYHVHSTSFGIFYQLIKPMLSNFQIVFYSYHLCFNYHMLILVSIEKIKCIQNITVTTMYPLYIPRIYIILGNLKSEYNIIIYIFTNRHIFGSAIMYYM